MVKSIFRKIVFPVSLNLGADKLFLKRSKKNNLVVMFHGVTLEDTTWFSPRHLPVDHFEKLIVYIKQNFNVLSIHDILENKTLAPKSNKKNICITFDDGYVNNLTHALPILEKHQVPATFFISTLCTRKDELNVLWADIITPVAKNQKEFEFDGQAYSLYYNSKSEHIFDVIKKMDAKQRDIALSDFFSRYQVADLLKNTNSDIWKLMTEHEIKMFSASAMVTIGSHGHMHYNLGEIDENDAVNDMALSKNILEQFTAKPITCIAYPDGSYSEKVKNNAERLGFKQQVAVHYHLQSDSTDPRIINRHGISSTTTIEANIIHLCRAFNKSGF